MPKLVQDSLHGRTRRAAMVRESEDQQKTWGRILGSRRAKTLRNRATTWKRYYIWLVLNRTRHWPTRIGDVLDYLEGRIHDGCGPTAPQGVMGALALLETVGRVEDSKKDGIASGGTAQKASKATPDWHDDRTGVADRQWRVQPLLAANSMGHAADVLDGDEGRRRAVDRSW